MWRTERKKKESMKEYKTNCRNNMLKKDSKGLKNIEVYVVTNFAKYKVENFSDTDIYTYEDDNGDCKENRITWFI